MRTLIIFTFLITICFQKLHAQNLVPNPSFEDTVMCPFNLSQIDYAIGWSSYRLTPDYFNICADPNPPNVSVPYNQWGYQYPKDGLAYGGFIGFTTGGGINREFIGCNLIQPLSVGVKYFVSFHVSAAKQGSIGIACNNIGARFSNSSFTFGSPAPIDNFSHIYSSTILSDTVNWMRISGSFCADSAYQFLMLGNFFDDQSTSYILFGGPTQIYSYYYIDDIKVSSDSLFVNGLSEFSNNLNITIFPNPATEEINLQLNGEFDILLIDNLGIIVQKYLSLSDHVKLNVSKLNSGVYYLEGKSHRYKFYKKVIIL